MLEAAKYPPASFNRSTLPSETTLLPLLSIYVLFISKRNDTKTHVPFRPLRKTTNDDNPAPQSVVQRFRRW